MKKILVSMLAVAAMVACSNEHTLVEAPQGGVIGFTTHVDKATRAAQDITSANIENFGVYASITNAASEPSSALILENEKVTKNGSNWTYANTQYWVPGNSYNFVAIAPFEDAQWTYATGNLAQNGTIAFDNAAAAGEQDLVYAYAQRENVTAGDLDAVGLTFNHLLSRVAFKFTNGFASSSKMTLEVYGVKINNAIAEAEVVVANGAVAEWAQVGTDTFERTFSKQVAKNEILATADVYATEHFYLLPIAQEYSITFSIDAYQAGVKVGTYTHTLTPEFNFAKGCSYSINATLNETNTGETAFDPIEFTVDEVVEWVENGGVALTTTEVATEAELFDAVANGENVILTSDIEVSKTLVIAPATRAANREVVLDLNGKTIKNALNNATTDVIVVAEGATLTINGEGTVEAVSGNDGYAVIAEGVVIINGGTFKSGVDANGEPNAVVYARNKGQVYVNGGYFPNDNVSKYVLNKKDADRATTTIEVRGGKFETFNPADNAAENPGTNFVAEGYGSYELEAGVWTVVSKNTTIDVATEAALFDAAEQGGNVVLTSDLVLSAPVKVTSDLNVNLNGKNLSCAADVFEVAAGNLTITGNGVVYAATTNKEPYCAVWAYGDAEVNIYGGEYKVGYPAGDYNDLIYAKDNALINICGGKFYNSGSENSFVLNIKDNSAAQIVVYGGEYEKFNPSNNKSEGEGTNFLAPGKTVEQNGDWYIVK